MTFECKEEVKLEIQILRSLAYSWTWKPPIRFLRETTLAEKRRGPNVGEANLSVMVEKSENKFDTQRR